MTLTMGEAQSFGKALMVEAAKVQNAAVRLPFVAIQKDSGAAVLVQINASILTLQNILAELQNAAAD